MTLLSSRTIAKRRLAANDLSLQNVKVIVACEISAALNYGEFIFCELKFVSPRINTAPVDLASRQRPVTRIQRPVSSVPRP
jgi:hypothetical protein